jgi:hypothetical protein
MYKSTLAQLEPWLLCASLKDHAFASLAGSNYFANACSFSLVLIFLCCTLFKMRMLLEPTEIMERMSSEQRSDARMDVDVLGAVLLASVLGSLVFSLLMMVAQIKWERQRKQKAMLAATSKRLRYVQADELVSLPKLPFGNFHLFLSHVWGSCRGVELSKDCPSYGLSSFHVFFAQGRAKIRCES